MNVEILEGCIACGVCESINSDVFIVNEKAQVITENIIGNEEDCIKASEICPVGVILVEE